MKKKIAMGMVMGGLVIGAACKPRQVDNGTYQSGPGGAAEEATATDQAETTVANLDSSRIIIMSDSLKKSKGRL